MRVLVVEDHRSWPPTSRRGWDVGGLHFLQAVTAALCCGELCQGSGRVGAGILPSLPGSGKFVKPWVRMHRENLSACALICCTCAGVGPGPLFGSRCWHSFTAAWNWESLTRVLRGLLRELSAAVGVGEVPHAVGWVLVAPRSSSPDPTHSHAIKRTGCTLGTGPARQPDRRHPVEAGRGITDRNHRDCERCLGRRQPPNRHAHSPHSLSGNSLPERELTPSTEGASTPLAPVRHQACRRASHYR